jgi:hypothetical protein
MDYKETRRKAEIKTEEQPAPECPPELAFDRFEFGKPSNFCNVLLKYPYLNALTGHRSGSLRRRPKLVIYLRSEP